MRFDYHLPEDQNFGDLSYSALAVSPDGNQIVYSTSSGLYLRHVDELTAQLIVVEESLEQPFFSPDGKWVGYYSRANLELKKISINGGTPVSLCDVTGLLVGAWWDIDNNIVFCQSPGDMMRVSANGGDPESFIKTNSAILSFPQVLPDKKSVLYIRSPAPFMIVVQSLESGKSKELFPGRYARYLPTGHIVYRTTGNANISAVPFDLDKLEVVGEPVSVVEDAIQGEGSESGTLVCIPGTEDPNYQRRLVWVDREGNEESIGAPPNLYRFPNISPDGTKVALMVQARGTRNADIRVWDPARENLMTLTLEGTHNITPIWNRDGRRIAYFSAHYGDDAKLSGIYWTAADGTGEAEQFCSIPDPETTFKAFGWLDEGKALVGMKSRGTLLSDIEMMPLETDASLKPLLAEDWDEMQPKISPNGRWLAYTSNESGRNEVYVRSLPDVDKFRKQISTTGGDSPLWSPDGNELFYRNGNSVMAVALQTMPELVPGKPETLFRGTYIQAVALEGNPWDISPDGKRFLMIKPSAEMPRKINIVLNWFEELKERAPFD
jgi:serine/threonine-protein kinase